MSAGDFSAFAFQVKQITLKMNRLQLIGAGMDGRLGSFVKIVMRKSFAVKDPFDRSALRSRSTHY
jgi:hypothetical protein